MATKELEKIKSNEQLITNMYHQISNVITENKTKGIIICKKDNQYIIEYCSDKRIIAKEYELI